MPEVFYNYPNIEYLVVIEHFAGLYIDHLCLYGQYRTLFALDLPHKVLYIYTNQKSMFLPMWIMINTIMSQCLYIVTNLLIVLVHHI